MLRPARVIAVLRAPHRLVDGGRERPMLESRGVAAELVDQRLEALAHATAAVVHVGDQHVRRVAYERRRVELALADERPRIDQDAAVVGEREGGQV